MSWLRASAAAARLGVTRSTVKRWVDDGQIPSKAILWVGTEARIADWYCDGHKTPPPAPVKEPAPTPAMHCSFSMQYQIGYDQ